MIDEPVANASSSSTQPNSCEVHSTTSSPRRDRCTPISAATNRNSATKSRSATASIEFGAAAVKPSSLATCDRVQRQRRAGQRAGAERARPRPGASQSRSRSRSRSSGCTWASSWCPNDDRLGVLQVGHARARACRRAGRPARPARRPARPAGAATPAGVVAQVEPQVGGDLVVAGPAGAQLAAERAEPLQQAALQRGVHVLVLDGRAGTRRTRRPPPGRPARPASGPARRRRAARPAASTRACARDAARSYGASRQSNCTLTDSRASASAGPPANRPPHRLVTVGRQRCSRSGLLSSTPRHGSPASAASPAGRPGRRPAGSAGPTARRSPWPATGRTVSPSS